MLLSMTGYGKAKDVFEGKSYTIDLKTLNGKLSDLRLKSPAYLRSKEIELRKIILGKLIRGKIDCSISVQGGESDADYALNFNLMESYLSQLSDLSERHNLDNQDLLQTIIRIPNVIQANDKEVGEEEWLFITRLLDQAIEELNSFRLKEGQSMLDDLNGRVETIKEKLAQVEQHEQKRHDEMVARIRKSIQENLKSESLDENRLEQELIYYLEKLDVHEEKIRLAQHCSYFLDTTKSEKVNTGKKLNFISQEMGREINTLGSKAQYSPLQQIVVEMKVELDQIKEQLANVL